jgi:hypothetical protein
MWTSIRNHCHFLANSLGEFEFTEPSLGVTLGLGGTHITHITHFIGCPSTYIDGSGSIRETLIETVL